MPPDAPGPPPPPPREPMPAPPPAALPAPPPPPVPEVPPAPPVALQPGIAPVRALLAAAALGMVAFAAYRFLAVGLAPTPVHLAGLATRLLLAVFLLLGALAPERTARLLRAPRLATPAGLVAFAFMGLTLYLLFGVGVVVENAGLLEQILAGADPEQLAGDVRRDDLMFALVTNFLVFTVPVLVWVAAAEGRMRAGFWAWLGLHRKGARWSVIWGLMAVLMVFWALIAYGLLTRAAGAEQVENERALAIAQSLTIPLALVVALLTGVGEEVFFRGFLLRKVGNVPQAILFGLAHLNYLHALELVVTTVLGYAFGRTVRKTGNLWGAIVGHAVFNAVSLVLAIAREQHGLGA